jgi:putative thiamine transport system substrate-binding protein
MTVPTSTHSPHRRSALQLGLAAVLPLSLPRPAAAQAPLDWPRITRTAQGQTVYFNAWGGSAETNAYLQWAAEQARSLFGLKVEHVKLADTAELVRRVRAEKAAGRNDGSADMVWINGENFLTMKREGLLFGPFAEGLPNFALVDIVGKPTTLIDFSEPVAGMEAAWGMAQLTFYADSRRVPQATRSTAELLAWAQKNPGRFTYPRPPQFHGTTFVKQALLEATADRGALYRPHTEAAFSQLTPVLWRYLDSLHPHLWRQGRAFPPSTAVMRQMVADGELWMSLSFNSNEAANHIASRQLPASVQSFQFSGGTLGNTHFLAIPFNARAKEGAMVLINFLQSPLAQARKADIRHWGDGTVLAINKLSAVDKALFAEAARAPGVVAEPAPVLPEPHGSWVDPLEREWLRRYGV